MLFAEIKWLGFIAPVSSLLIFKLQHILNVYLRKLSLQKKEIGDKRGQKISETVQGIKLIKFNALESVIMN